MTQDSACHAEDPLLFTLEGVQGYVRFDGSFLPLAEFKKMEEEDSIVWDFICEQYDIEIDYLHEQDR